MIPTHVTEIVARHVAALRAFNAEVHRLRVLGFFLGSPGRYEWEYRVKTEADIDARSTRLDELEVLARANDENPGDLYAGQTRPVKLPWSPEARAWRRPEEYSP